MDWHTDWHPEWLTDWLTIKPLLDEWLTDLPADRLTCWLNNRCFWTSERSVLGKYWSSSFLQVYGPSRRQKKRTTAKFSQYGPNKLVQKSFYYYGSISNSLTAQRILSVITRALLQDQKISVYHTIFAEFLPKFLVRQQEQKKRFYLTAKCFLLNDVSRTKISEFSSWAVYLSGPYIKIRIAQGTNQNAPFHLGPVQPYNKMSY